MTHECVGREREVARIRKPDIVEEDHGFMMFSGTCVFDSSAQGFGVEIDMEFVRRLMRVFRAERLSQLEGKACFVTHCQSRIHKVEPLLHDDGKAFDVDAWADELQGAKT
jgi:hypothetical protein